MDKESWKPIEKYSHLGMTIGASIGGMTYLGKIVDDKFDSSPAFVLVGFFWGFFGSIIYLMRFVKKMNEENEK
ncbi:MAG: AtpZ/AtpI family protein [Candidatus Delongbacteria bacterium]|nr:AtpZ/AtpI family protein [Candidatus Delongbacteria bacterium]MBN2836594.1 AtpZ/AtpI family protein [Candidatus Delongbacteria bacterium]